MKLKLDENLSDQLKTILATLGHDAHTVGDEGLIGRPDADVAAAALAEGRMLFTLDLDFADIRRFPPGTHPGIVLFRPGSFGPLEITRFVAEFARTCDLSTFAGCLAVVEPTRVRVRRPDPSPPDTHESPP